jgi:hypothetical protein
MANKRLTEREGEKETIAGFIFFILHEQKWIQTTKKASTLHYTALDLEAPCSNLLRIRKNHLADP